MTIKKTKLTGRVVCECQYGNEYAVFFVVTRIEIKDLDGNAVTIE